MTIKCPICFVKYEVLDSQIRPGENKFKCSKCLNNFSIEKPVPEVLTLQNDLFEKEREKDLGATLTFDRYSTAQDQDELTSILRSVGRPLEALPIGISSKLEILNGLNKGIVFSLKSPKTIIGRQKADIILNDDPEVSRQHCLIEFYEGSVVIRDLNSTNGTFVNNIMIKAYPLKNNNTITIGNTLLQFSI
ncbi:MAG: FHA domain-containing protein [bacterium]